MVAPGPNITATKDSDASTLSPSFLLPVLLALFFNHRLHLSRPRFVTVTKEYAFYDCASLVRITIPDRLTRIEGWAFCGCDSLISIRLSVNLVSIGDAFRGCKSLEAVFLPPTVTYIGDDAFINCKSLRFCILPESVVHVSHSVFYGCDRLSTTDRNKLSRVCYSASVNPKTIQECIHTHGIERATEVNGQQMMTYAFYCKFKNYVLLLHARSSSSFILLRL